MEITEVEPIVVEPAVGTLSAPGGATDFEMTVRPILVRIHTNAGHIGLGETYLDDPSGHMARAIADGVRSLGEHLVGEDPREVTRLWQNLYVLVKRSEAYRPLSAIDEALWDLLGKSVGEPVYRLLGGAVGEVRAYATFAFPKTASELAEAAAWFDQKGFPMMKIVAGHGVEADRDRLKSIVPELPGGFGLAIDANTTYGFTDALAVAETASEYGLEWFEEPIAHTDVAGMARLNRRVSVPIAAYQNHHIEHPALDHLRANALEIYQPSLDRVGGITSAWRIATLVDAFEKRLVPHAFGPGVNYAASLHVAAASPACDLIEFAVYDDAIDDPGRFIASPYLHNQADISVQAGGAIRPPEAPGLGVELDEDALEQCRVDY